MAAYATRRDVFKYGLPRGLLANEGRFAHSALASTDEFTLDGHGFVTDDPVIVRAADGGSVPSPLIDGDTYYVIRLTDSTFKLAATSGGSAIDLTDDGENVVVVMDLPFEDVLERYSRFVDDFLIAHAVPMPDPVPVNVVAVVAELAGKKLLLLSGQTSVSMDEAEKAALAQLDRWKAGIPLRDENATDRTNLAVTANSASVSGTDPRGWGTGCLP